MFLALSLLTQVALANTAPVADAGTDQAVDLGDTVTIDGSASYDPDGDSLSTRWKFMSVPTDSALWSNDIDDRDSAITTFTPDAAGTYWLALKADDGTEYVFDYVTITVTDPNNTAPVADASSSDSSVYLGSDATLDSSASTDADGNSLTPRWKVMSVPSGSGIWSSDIANRNSASTTFTPDVVGTYTVALRVHDGSAWSDWTTHALSVTDSSNNAPVADAGTDATADLATLTLDASGSSDADGDALTYRWKLVYSTNGSATTSNDIVDRDSATTTFTPDVAGEYYFSVLVDDGQETDRAYVLYTVTEWDTFYADVDDDGFGDAASSVTAETQPSGYVTDSTDCDDDSAVTYPGATELCDGVQNDCDDSAWASDAGLVSLQDSDGNWTDETSTWAAGTAASVVSVSYTDDGTLNICEGEWYVSTTLSASNFDVVGIDGKDLVILNGGTTDRLFNITTSASIVSISDLTVTDGYNSSAGGAIYALNFEELYLADLNILGSTSEKGGGGHFYNLDLLDLQDVYVSGNEATKGYGGGLNVYDVASFTGSNIELDGNLNSSSYGGGGLATYGSVTSELTNLTLTNNEITNNYGGGWSIISGTHTVTGFTVEGNIASGAGGGIDSTGDLTLYSGSISGNEGNYGGALRMKGGDFVGEDVVIDSNYANSTGAIVHLASSTSSFTCTDCDFTDNTHASSGKGGINVSSGFADIINGDFSGNTDYDVKSGSTYTYGSAETFYCDGSSCY